MGPEASTATGTWLPTTYTWSKRSSRLHSLLVSPSSERRCAPLRTTFDLARALAPDDCKGDDVIVRAAVVGAIASPTKAVVGSGPILTIASGTLPMAADGAGRRRGGRADSPGPRTTRRGRSSRSPASRFVVLGGQALRETQRWSLLRARSSHQRRRRSRDPGSRDRLGGVRRCPCLSWGKHLQLMCAAQELSLVVSGETRSAWATGCNRADRSSDLGRRAGTARRARPRERKRYS
jgi:hypothetical protein